MEIKINLEDYKCEDILAMHKYVTEEVTAYYENRVEPYDNVYEGALYPTKIKVAYHPMSRPKVLENEYPMLEDVREYEYQKVVNELFVSDLWYKMYR